MLNNATLEHITSILKNAGFPVARLLKRKPTLISFDALYTVDIK